MNVEVYFSPALYPHYAGNEYKIVVVVDIFRASTTICAAFENGARSIIPVATIEEAQAYKQKGFLVGAERNVKRCDFADFGNSPFDYTKEKVKGKDIVFTTTNGTQAINTASDCSSLLIGAFSNIRAVCNYCIEEEKDVTILCAGWNNRFNLEDTMFAGALARLLIDDGNFMSASDATNVALLMWKEAEPNIKKYTAQADHIKRLEANNLSDSVDYCLTLNTVNLVPVYHKDTGKITVL